MAKRAPCGYALRRGRPADDVLDNDGMTPLALAVENEFLDAVELLLEYRAEGCWWPG